MDNKELKAFCEQAGFGIAHVRRKRRTGELVAYVAALHKTFRAVHELRYREGSPVLQCYTHALKANGFTQYDKLIGNWNIAANKWQPLLA